MIEEEKCAVDHTSDISFHLIEIIGLYGGHAEFLTQERVRIRCPR